MRKARMLLTGGAFIGGVIWGVAGTWAYKAARDLWGYPKRTENLAVTWTHAGKPHMVTGTVLDSIGEPMAFQHVQIQSSPSNWTGAWTDSEGRFSAELKAGHIEQIGVDLKDVVRWRWVGPDLDRAGVDFAIQHRSSRSELRGDWRWKATTRGSD